MSEVETLMFQVLQDQNPLRITASNQKLFMSRVAYAKRKYPELKLVRAIPKGPDQILLMIHDET